MDKRDYAMITLSLVTLVSLGLQVMPDENYYCNSIEKKAYCFSLSSTSKTCYTLPNKLGGKVCSEGWKKFDFITPIKSQPSGGYKYLCDEFKCTPLR